MQELVYSVWPKRKNSNFIVVDGSTCDKELVQALLSARIEDTSLIEAMNGLILHPQHLSLPSLSNPQQTLLECMQNLAKSFSFNPGLNISYHFPSKQSKHHFNLFLYDLNDNSIELQRIMKELRTDLFYSKMINKKLFIKIDQKKYANRWQIIREIVLIKQIAVQLDVRIENIVVCLANGNKEIYEQMGILSIYINQQKILNKLASFTNQKPTALVLGHNFFTNLYKAYSPQDLHRQLISRLLKDNKLYKFRSKPF